MTSLSFPDVNVWFALLVENHVHHAVALRWWQSADNTAAIAFCRVTQLSVLRLLTTAAAMNQQPLTMNEAWGAYDRLFGDDRVTLVPEPTDLEPALRAASMSGRSASASPKAWADAYLIAFASCLDAQLITFDQALYARAAPQCVMLG